MAQITKKAKRAERRLVLQEELVQEVAHRARYWAQPARPDGTLAVGCPPATTEYRCEGVAFSILADLDGASGQAYTVQAWDEERGEWSEDLTGGLHERFHEVAKGLSQEKYARMWGDPVKVYNALSVMVLDKNIRAWLRENDPKALDQALNALGTTLAEIEQRTAR